MSFKGCNRHINDTPKNTIVKDEPVQILTFIFLKINKTNLHKDIKGKSSELSNLFLILSISMISAL